MFKRFALIAALFLTACGGTETVAPAPAPETKIEDGFLVQLQKDYPVTLSKISDTIWVHTTNYRLPGQNPIPSNGLVVIDGEDVILVDAAWGELATISLLERVKAETGKEVTKLIVTHHHADRTMGVDAAERAGVQVFTHPDTPTLAARAGWPVPNTSVAALKEPKSRTKVGAVEVAYPGPGHAVDNLVVYIPSQKLLYGGCAVRGAGSAGLGNIKDANLEAWPDTLAWMKSTYPETTLVVPGHGKGGGLTLLDETVTLINAATAEE